MQIFQLSNDTRTVDVDLGATGLSTTAMALELLGFGETAFTSVSQADIQEIGSNIYRITFTEAQVNREGFLLFSLTGTGFDPFIGLLFTVTEIDDSDPSSGVPVSQIGSLPVVAFSGITPVTGLTVSDFNTPNGTITFKKADEVEVSTKTVATILEPVNEFAVARGVYLIEFTATELNRIGNFDYKVTGSSFDDFETSIQVTEPAKQAIILEVRDTSPGLISPTPVIPTTGDLETFIETTVPVNRLDFQFDQFGIGYVGLVFEYFNGTAFTILTVTDTTQAFTRDGAVTWELPGDQVVGGTGTPNQDNFFIKVSVTSISGDAELKQLDSGVVVAGVTLTVSRLDGTTLDTLTTSDLGRSNINLALGDVIVTLQKGSSIFNENNVRITVIVAENAGDLQVIVLEGASVSLVDPSVDPTLITLKVDLRNLEGNPVQRQEIRLEHRFRPVFFSGTNTILGRTVSIITDDVGHAELLAVAGSALDTFLTNTPVSRQIVLPQPRSGTGDTPVTAPTIRFVSGQADSFVAADVNAIITIAGVDRVITRVVDGTEIEVSPTIPGDLVNAVWDMKKVDLFSLISVAPDQFSVAIPIFNFAIRTTL